MLISTPAIYLMLRRLTATDTPDIESAGTAVHTESSQISNENLNILKKIGRLSDDMMAAQASVVHVYFEELFKLTLVFLKVFSYQ